MTEENIVGSLCAGDVDFASAVNGHSYIKILGKPRPYLRNSHARGRQMYSMRACGQRDIGSAIDQDFTFRCAREGHDKARQLVQGMVRQIFLSYLYEIDSPVESSLDTRNKRNSSQLLAIGNVIK